MWLASLAILENNGDLPLVASMEKATEDQAIIRGLGSSFLTQLAGIQECIGFLSFFACKPRGATPILALL
jgi:hypothetical protein